jgi:hypothetical protein
VAKAVCPDCEQLVTIVPTGERQGRDPSTPKMFTTSSTWWLITDHDVLPTWAPPGAVVESKKCPGSGKKV